MAGFKKPQMDQLVQPQDKDAVDRTVAAGVQIMYAPETSQSLRDAVDSQDPVSERMARNVAGLMLILDKKAQGKIPIAAIFPAALELLGEAAEVLESVKQPVTQADYNEAALMLAAILAGKMGATEEQVMQAGQQVLAKRGSNGNA